MAAGLELATSLRVTSTAMSTLTEKIRPTVRRFLGILTGICALYLTVGAVDAPCLDHDRDSSAQSAPTAMSHQSTHHEEPEQKGGQPKPCKTAAIPCCTAMTSCGTTIIALGNDGSPDAFWIEGRIAPASHLSQPLSRIAAPEPPPPKA
jgi:hypothetical protein